jgi:UDP-N-acetyl-2-amino-2-deoxyglucuronate dehydrogenase
VISPWNLDQLAALEAEHDRRVFTVLQLRLLACFREFKAELVAAPSPHRAEIELTYVTARGRWYDVSWKGVPEKSGGLALNIGVHFFDLLIWLFGAPLRSDVYLTRPDKLSGVFELERARVRWFLSVDRDDLPAAVRAAGKHAFRSLRCDGRELEFSDHHPDIYSVVYREILDGRGVSIDDVRPSIQLAHDIRTAPPIAPRSDAHPLLASMNR